MGTQKNIILASASPRRKEIFSKTGLKFKIDAGDYEEDMSLDLMPHELARFLSLKKAEAVAGKYKNVLIIAADTFIVYRGRLLGKPHTEEEARRMLTMLNGKAHSVITGFSVLDVDTNKAVSRSVATKVYFKKMTIKEMDAYVRTREPLDKAGAYAIQELGAVLVKKIEGDYFNVVGLPLSALVDCLKKFGVHVL